MEGPKWTFDLSIGGFDVLLIIYILTQTIKHYLGDAKFA